MQVRIDAAFLPSEQIVARLGSEEFRCVYLNPEADSPAYLETSAGEFFQLEWNAGDVEFRFEVYYADIGITRNPNIAGMTRVEIPQGAGIEAVVVTEWLRKALPGELPDGFGPVVEERGLLSEVPENASMVAVGLYGIAFLEAERERYLVVGLNDFHNCRFFVEADSVRIGEVRKKFTFLPLADLAGLAQT